MNQETDNESVEALQRLPFQQSQNSSFKRSVPAMGNRGLETRNSKRQLSANTRTFSKPEQSSVSVASTPTGAPVVGALEVQNVKKAINRYGTLPKGARIGAYLESLRQPEGQQQDVVITSAIPETSQQATMQNSAVSPRAAIKSQPQMIRSNSSGGVTMANSATASLNKLQRHRTATDSSMVTFSSFRGSSGSPKRIVQPTLADLEFPPPPTDLPEEFENAAILDLPAPPKSHGLPPHPQQSLITQKTPNNDVSNTEPSVEEASTRFGVSLRKREPSTDSCSSLGSPADLTMEGMNAPVSIKEKLEMKLMAEIRERASTIDNVPKNESAANETVHYKSTEALRKSTLPPKPDNHSSGLQQNFKTQLKKVDPKKINTKQVTKKDESNNIIDFKSRLRKVENQDNSTADGNQGTSDSSCEPLSGEDVILPAPPPPPIQRVVVDERTNGNIKSKDYASTLLLNKVENTKTEIKIDKQGSQVNDISSDEGKLYIVLCVYYFNSSKLHFKGTNNKDVEDEKRRSTGSISSLKKMWEAKESSLPDQVQLSPKLGLKNISNNKSNNDDEQDKQTSNDVDHLISKKPAVPIKPSKLIYATPTIPKITTPVPDANVTNSAPLNPGYAKRDGILELINVLETSLKIPVASINAAQWLQLSERLNTLQLSCNNFVDKESMPPHSKFQFRELVTRVENQSHRLRSAGTKNLQDNEKLVHEVGQSLKQISNALNR